LEIIRWFTIGILSLCALLFYIISLFPYVLSYIPRIGIYFKKIGKLFHNFGIFFDRLKKLMVEYFNYSKLGENYNYVGGNGRNKLKKIIDIDIKKLYDNIKNIKKIEEISIEDAVSIYKMDKPNNNDVSNNEHKKNEFISSFYKELIDFLDNQFLEDKEGIRSGKILTRLRMLYTQYNNNILSNNIANFVYESIKNQINTEANKNKINNKTIKREVLITIEKMDETLFNLKKGLKNSLKANVIKYEINKYKKNQKIENSKNIKNVENVENIIIKINDSILNKLKPLYDQIVSKLNELIESMKQTNITNSEKAFLKSNNTEYQKLSKIISTNENEGKIIDIKRLIEEFVGIMKNINGNNDKKKQLLKIMPLVLTLKKVEKNMKEQQNKKNKLTNEINKRGFIKNLEKEKFNKYYEKKNIKNQQISENMLTS